MCGTSCFLQADEKALSVGWPAGVEDQDLIRRPQASYRRMAACLHVSEDVPCLHVEYVILLALTLNRA